MIIIFLQLLTKNYSQELTKLYSQHSSELSILLALTAVVDLQGLQPL